MDTGVLFDHLDRVERRESPLTPIRRWLSSDHRYVETDQTCPGDDCNGMVWEGPEDKLCDQCSMVADDDRAKQTLLDKISMDWYDYLEDRPRYRNSNKRRQVGSFDHDWVESEDVDGSIDLVDPVDFYEAD